MMLKNLYEWVLSLAARRSAEVWLAFIAIIESSVFLVPADVLFLPMALAQPKRAYRYALIATAGSVIGGILGYMLGSLAFESIIKPMLTFYGELGKFEQMKACTSNETLLILLVTSGLAHLPPIKIVTILAGVAQISLLFFVVSCVLARGARFFALAYALRRWGEPIRDFIEKRLGLIAGLLAAILIALYLAVKFLAQSGSLSC
jgi:membrane protein YqaA with SNARE-associated domain